MRRAGCRIYDPLTLLVSCRCPKPPNSNDTRRIAAARLTLEAVLDGYGATDAERSAAPASLAVVFDDVADFLLERGAEAAPAGTMTAIRHAIAQFRWQAQWWRTVQQ